MRIMKLRSSPMRMAGRGPRARASRARPRSPGLCRRPAARRRAGRPAGAGRFFATRLRSKTSWGSFCPSQCRIFERARDVLHRAQPVQVRPRVDRGDDLDHLGVPQRLAQRDDGAVGLGRQAVVADVGVDVVGEVDRRGAVRQLHDVALGREDVDRVAEQLALDLVEEVGGAGPRALPLLELADQRQLRLPPASRGGRAALVEPVRGDAVLRGARASSWVRIWISITRPPQPITVVCRLW